MTAQTPSRHTLSVAWPWILLAALLLTPAPPPAQAQSGASSDEEISLFNEGSILYQRNCTNCHGVKGKGDGQVASLLKVKPADLTRLAATHGGTFPTEEVSEAIDGRKAVVAHGGRDMPIWGEVFVSEGQGPEAEAQAARKIRALVEYLKTIQAP